MVAIAAGRRSWPTVRHSTCFVERLSRATLTSTEMTTLSCTPAGASYAATRNGALTSEKPNPVTAWATAPSSTAIPATTSIGRTSWPPWAG